MDIKFKLNEFFRYIDDHLEKIKSKINEVTKMHIFLLKGEYANNKKKDYTFAYYFGLPGCGKTTFAAYLAKKYLKRNIRVYSNVPILNCLQIDKSDIGVYLIENGLLINDEAGVEYSNSNMRNRKISDEEIKFYKYHRHFKVDVVCFSQSHDDIDVVLRRLCNRMYYLKKSIIPGFVRRREIIRKFTINKDTHQPEFTYHWKFLGKKYIFCPPLWKMFDSHSTYNLPKKSFRVYN